MLLCFLKPADLIWTEVGAEIIANGKTIGTAGIVAQPVKEKFDFKNLSPVAAEIDFQQLAALQARAIKVKPIPRFPTIQRDLSILVDEKITWADVTDAINKKSSDELEDVRFVEIYRGKGVPAGKKSLTLSLRFRDQDGTLTHETVDGFEKAIVNSLAKSVKAQLRTL